MVRPMKSSETNTRPCHSYQAFWAELKRQNLIEQNAPA
jgi:hypothetical protein